jgi:hypothetical protein
MKSLLALRAAEI